MSDETLAALVMVPLVLIFLLILADAASPRGLREAWRRERPAPPVGLLAEKLREEFIVTLRTGETFRGLLEAEDARWVLLRQVDALTQDVDGTAKHTPVDGELVLPRDQISYLQRP